METSSRRLSFQTDGSDVRSSGDSFGTVRKSILKKQSFIDVRDDLERALEASASVRQESPEQWFQRIMKEQSLSPLDLCDQFCFGDARKHRLVPLKSVCEMLFELDPGNDPLTETMEEFLFRFSFDQGDGEIVIDIKEALRTLDIWKTAAPRSPTMQDHDAIGSPRATVSPAKAAMLQVKAEKLKQVVSSLQLENLRLSRALDTGDSALKDEQRAPSPLKIAIKKAAQDAKATSSSNSSNSSSKQQTTPKVVSRHEQELIALANRLGYHGVKKLEELLVKSDAVGSGFMSLKQLRWLLANECESGGDISESKLMELCMGMNFNAQAHLDYKEFVRVLLDILIYESRPSVRSSGDNRSSSSNLSEADDAALSKVREYLKSLYGSREKTRELVEQLCEKYDLEGNQSLSLAELSRVFQNDLTNQHPAKLKFPLTASDTKRLLNSLSEAGSFKNTASQRSSRDEDNAVFLYYPAIVDAIFRADSSRSQSQDASVLMARVVQPEFWQALRRALCSQNDNPSLERKIHAQLCKILAKLDPKHSFGIAQRHFARVFDQHWSSRDLELLAKALASPLGRSGVSGWIRYDVLMKMLFGAPALRDASALAEIVQKLQQTARVWREELMMASHGRHAHKSLSYLQVHELLSGGKTVSASPLNVTEFLYLVAEIKDGNHRVDTQKLWSLLTSELRPTSADRNGNQSNLSPSSSQFAFLRQCLRVLCDEHDLEKTLGRRARHEHGVVRLDDLTQELLAQLRWLPLTQQDKSQVTEEIIESFLDCLCNGDDSTSPTADSLYIHALMDAIFDWDGLISALRLPDRLVDVKKTLELFDWHKNGSIDADDWVKAWRQFTVGTGSAKQRTASPLHDWEMSVLVKRFPAAATDTNIRRSQGGPGAIDYSRLLVFLLERQQRGARTQLHEAVCLLLQQVCDRVTQGKTHMTTFHLEQAFEQIDRDGKGYFQIGDLRIFVLRELEMASESGMDVHTLRSYASQGTALESVMQFLVGSKDKDRKKVVSLMRFQELVNHGFFQQERGSRRKGTASGSRRSSSDEEDELVNGSTDESSETVFEPRQRRGRSSSQPRIEAHITLLRDLEQCIVDVAKQFTDSHGQISPADAYNHLNDTTKQAPQHQHRRPRSQSPVRSSYPTSPRSVISSSSHASRRLSCTTPSSTIDPLTASRLKQTLRSVHGIETSTHLIGQFFLRLGSNTKHFLELAVFAKWIAPLSIDLQARVKQIVREMLVKSKSGGGHVDLERFLGALSRRMYDALATEAAMTRSTSHGHSQRYADAEPPLKVKPGVLLTRLHQLNVSLRKPEMAQLLRYFGLDDQHEIDYTEFVRRLYELAHQLPMQ